MTLELLSYRRWASVLSPRLVRACRFAVQSLKTARQRALFALLGIAIGVAAVVALMSLGKSAEQKALAEFESMGTQIVSVSIQEPASKSRTATPMKDVEVSRYLDRDPDVSAYSEIHNLQCMQSGKSATQMQMAAVQPVTKDILGLKVAHGRFLLALDGNQKWMVLGARAADTLAKQGASITPGSVLSVCGQSFTVAGILAASAQAESSLMPLSLDDALLVSVMTARRIEPALRLESLVLRLRDNVAPVAYAETVKHALSDLTGKEIQINTAQKIIQLRQEQAATYTRFLAALSSISLLVGGLGILNIMLIAVVERRREIGIRMALGAEDRDIAWQFVCESALIGLTGGVVGVAAGLLLAALGCWLTGLPYVVAVSSIPLAVLISMALGVGAGVYPALRAASLDPIETLQSN